MWQKNSIAVVALFALSGAAAASEDMESIRSAPTPDPLTLHAQPPIAPPAPAPIAPAPAAQTGSAGRVMDQKALGSMTQAEYLRYRIQLKNQTELNNAQIQALESQQKLEMLQRSVSGVMPVAPLEKSATSSSSMPTTSAAQETLKSMSVYAIFSDNGDYTAEIRSGRGVIPVRVGDTLPGEHKVVSITATDVRVRDRSGNESSVSSPAERQRATSGMPSMFPPPPLGVQ